jgi:hypothetical protein
LMIPASAVRRMTAQNTRPCRMKLSRVPLADLPVDRITFSPGRVNDAYLSGYAASQSASIANTCCVKTLEQTTSAG